MKSGSPIKIPGVLVLLCLSFHGLANNITVSAISLTNRTTSTQTVRVNFTLSWENSWRTTSAPFNWDAAWVFVKYKEGTTGEWKHATLASSGHTLPGIAASTQPDATGIFIYRSAAGGPSTFNPTGIQLQWNYGSDGVSNEAQIFVRVFAIEMVYNQVGGFQAGSGAISNGEFRRANDITSSGTASTFTITGTIPTLQGNSSSSSPTNIAAYNNNYTDLTGTNTATLAAGYPTGFNAFYSMKYEISQQQYVDFLNTLTYTQQAARTATAPNNAAGTGALINPNVFRNGIDIQTPGTSSPSVPAVYACNLNGNGTFNESDDGQHIACNYLSWDDLTAYLDWAGLRPMTELEYEKSCRGNQSPVASEYPWGTTTAVKPTSLTNAGNASEVASNSTANIAFDISSTGPVRTGIFAGSSTDRNGSGAGYYGNMDLGGNLWERVVTIGTSDGRTFSATHGNGTLASSGASDVSGWPAASGSGWKGGSYDTLAIAANSSGRTQAANGNNNRVANAGGRGVRTISSGIVTDGLVLWLDAGITSSYPESGTTWTDLSGNRNNGTLTNGPTYNSSNEGSIGLDGVDDFVTVASESQIANSNEVSAELFFVVNGTSSTVTGIQYLLFRKNSRTGNFEGFQVFLSQSNRRICATSTSSSGTPQVTVQITSPINYGSIYHVIATFKSNDKIQLFLNGTLQASINITHSLDIPSGPTVKLGRTTESFDGPANAKIFVTRIYNRVLSSSEVLQNFNAQKARFGL